MYAVVTAGGIPQPDEPLFEYTRGGSKALLEIAGKPMIQWVLDALTGAQTVEGIVVAGLPADCGIRSPKLREIVPNQGDMMENVRSGIAKTLQIAPHIQHVFTVSSDIPGITPEMVDWVGQRAMETDDDFYYNVITRQVMEARYPNSRRSYVKLKDVEVCGGDLNIVRAVLATSDDALWKRIIASRKNALKQAALIGFDTLLLVMLRLITIEQAARLASRRLKLAGRALMCPYAEIGMDVDKPFQLEIMRADLASRIPA